MAAFDAVNVPTMQDSPSFRTTPSVATKPDFKSPTGIAEEYIGKGIEEGASEINKGVQKYAENVGVEAGEKIQSDYGSRVQAVYNKTFPQDAGDPGTDTLVPGKSGAPPQVEQGLSNIKNIQSGYEQGSAPGHIRETQYLKNLYMEASRLRAQWPGYREYIDKGIEKATGITPNANSYIKSMLADINEMATKKNSADEKEMTHIITEAAGGNSQAISALNLVQSGKIPLHEGFNRVAQSNITKFASQQAEQNLKTTEAGTKINNQIAVDNVRDYVGKTANQFTRDWLDHMGLTQDVMDRLSKGELTFEQLGVDPRTLDSALSQQERVFKAQTDSWADKPHDYLDPVTGKPIAGAKQSWRVAAGKDYDDIYKQNTEVFGMLHTALRNPESGYIGRIANSVKDMNNNAQWNVWKGSDATSQQLRGLKLLTEFGGSQYTAQLVGRPGWSTPDINSLNSIIGNTLGGVNRPGLNGIKESLATIDKETHGEKPDVARTYLNTLGRLVGAPDVKDEGKLNIIRHLFDPKEQGWVGLIQEGNQSISRHDMFNKFTNPDFVKNLTTLANSHNDPQMVENYKNWVLKTFDSDLFSHDIHDLSNYESRQGVHIRWNTPPGRAPYFDAEPQGGQYSVKGTATQFYAQSRAVDINRNLTKLNMGISSIYNVYKDETPGLLLREFQAQGVDPTQSQYLPAGLVGAMAASKAPIEGSTKAQDRVKPSEGTLPAAQPNASVQPPVVPVQGAPGAQSGKAPWTIEQSPGYQMGYTAAKRLGNVAGDAWQRYRHALGFE